MIFCLQAGPLLQKQLDLTVQLQMLRFKMVVQNFNQILILQRLFRIHNRRIYFSSRGIQNTYENPWSYLTSKARKHTTMSRKTRPATCYIQLHSTITEIYILCQSVFFDNLSLLDNVFALLVFLSYIKSSEISPTHFAATRAAEYVSNYVVTS